jgi:hypothetical protein
MENKNVPNHQPDKLSMIFTDIFFLSSFTTLGSRPAGDYTAVSTAISGRCANRTFVFSWPFQ